MAYLMIETSIRTHPKFLAAGPEASWLWVCGLGYCQDGLTNGFIPTAAIDFLGVKDARVLVDRLVAVRLWEARDGGWTMHDYLEHNKSADEVREIMRKRKEGGKLGGRPRKNLEGFTDVDSEPNLLENPVLPVLPVRPVLTGTTEGQTDSTAASASARGQEPSEARTREDAVLWFPTIGPGGGEWPLRKRQVAEWVELYPGLNVLAEMRKAKAWLLAKPNRRKTARGMSAFCVNWLSRATDNRHAGGRSERQEYRPTQIAITGDEWKCPHDPVCHARHFCVSGARDERDRMRAKRAAS